MTGAFFGSLAASASVFVAILTALLVNEYVHIKGEREQIDRRLEQIEGQLARLNQERETYEQDVQNIHEEWEAEYREEAEEEVDEFIDEVVGLSFIEPIETFTVHDLLEELADYHEYDDVDDMRGNAERHHHRELLEERMDEIEEEIVPLVAERFAKQYEGEGWPQDRDRKTFEERVAEKRGEDVESIFGEQDSMSFEDFVDEYRKEHDVDSVRDRTRDALNRNYKQVVSAPKSDSEYPSRSYGLAARLSDTSRPNRGLLSRAEPDYDFSQFEHDLDGFPGPEDRGESVMDSIVPPDPQYEQINLQNELFQRRRYNKANDELTRIKSQIQGLKQEQDRLQSKKDDFQPEMLRSAIGANVATIILSVVVPMMIYLFIVTDTTVWASFPFQGLEYGIGFFSWVIGLGVVFYWLYIHVHD